MGRPHGGNAVAAYVFLDVALVVVLARLTGALFRRLRQPAVVAGILLGPTFLGGIPLGGGRHLETALLPPEVRPMLTTLANLGLVVFMFIVGLELNLGLVRGNGRRAGGVSLASVAVPFALGVGLAGVLFPAHRTGHDVPRLRPVRRRVDVGDCVSGAGPHPPTVRAGHWDGQVHRIRRSPPRPP